LLFLLLLLWLWPLLLALLIITAIKEARNRIVSAILTGIATEIDWESSSNSEIRDPSSEQNEQRSPTESEFRPALPSNRIEKGRKVLSERHQKKRRAVWG